MKTAFMSRLTTFFFAAIMGLLVSLGMAHAGSGSAGKEFYFSFQPNMGANGELSLLITGEKDTQGTVAIAGLNFTAPFFVAANQVTTVAIPRTAQQVPTNVISRLAVHVVARDDVTIYGLNRYSASTDAFLALPIDALGLEYFALSYVSNVSPWSYPSQSVITGAFDNTHVTITPKLQLSGHSAGQSFTITLNRGDTYLLSSDFDVSGTNIVADAPVAVTSGAQCVNVPTGVSACDHIVEMMPPVSTWGKSFLVVPLATRLKGEVFRIIAAESDTKININGTLVATLQHGEIFETVLKGYSQIETTAPALVAQYSPGLGFDGVNSDPFMMLIPPTEQFLNQYTFSAPVTGFVNYVNVVVPSAEVGSLQLDGTTVDSARFSVIGSSGFSGAQLPISVGSHHLASTSNATFGIYVYGYAAWDSFGYPGGMSFKAINPVGDPYLPNLRLVQVGGTLQGTAADSEDVNANGVLDAGEDINGNGKIDRRSEDVSGNGKLDPGEDTNGNNILDRDAGIFKVEILPGSDNLKLDALPYVPGALAAQFSIARIDLTKPGTGVLHIEDGAGNTREAPVSIGAVAVLRNVRVIETLATAGIELDLTSFAKQPFSITDGTSQKIIEWRFDAFNADSMADLGFDVVLRNPVASENRLVSQKVDLYYDDVNGEPVHTELGSLKVDVYPSNFQITPVTDKASYGANDTVQITSTVNNLSAYAGMVAVRLTIVDAGSTQVAVLGTIPSQTVAAGATTTFYGLNFPTAANYVGGYRVLAELVDAEGKVLAQGSTTFKIAAGSGTNLASTVSVDKLSYALFDTVKIQTRLTNLASNLIFDNLIVSETVTDSAGKTVFSDSQTILQLAGGSSRDLSFSFALNNAVPGTYAVTQTVMDATGVVLDSKSISFTVQSTAATGSGLKGTVASTPKETIPGGIVTVNLAVSNLGNADLSNLPLTLSIVDPVASKVAVSWNYSVNIVQGNTFTGTAAWTASGTGKTAYVAVLAATVGGKSITLASDNFTVAEPPVKLDVKHQLLRQGRLLVLLTCKHGERDDDRKQSRAGSLKPKSSEHQEHWESDDDDDRTCIDQRAQFLDAALTALGIEHAISATLSDFTLSFRSGKYNVYWLSGGAQKLDNDLAQEIREAVNRGDGLLLEGVHDERNGLLDEVAGILYRGKLSTRNQSITLTGPMFTAGTNAPTRGQPLKLALAGGTQQAKFPAGIKCDDCDDDKKSTSGETPAIVSNAYGKGRGMLMAFDLIDSLMRIQPAPLFWQEIMQVSFAYLSPQTLAPGETEVLGAGAYAVARTTLANQGQAVALEVTDLLPPGAAVISTSPQATVNPDNTQAKWSLNLGVGQIADLTLALRVPQASGSHTLASEVASLWNGQVKPYGSYPLTLNVASAMELTVTNGLINELKALSFTTSRDREARDQAVKALQDAIAKTAQGKNDDAIEKLLDAIAKLRRIGGKDMSSYRLAIDRWLRELELEWLNAKLTVKH